LSDPFDHAADLFCRFGVDCFKKLPLVPALANQQKESKKIMQHYLIVWSFPTVEGSWQSCPGFADYINGGCPGDQFDGFALQYRVCEPISGSGVAIVQATDIGKVWAHLGPWIKGYGIQFEVNAVVTDREFASMWPAVEAAAAVV
tara:strand:+ start:1924 stop:2358 length:435 start_codon:yes stop_codon:yes gene_type:complete